MAINERLIHTAADVAGNAGTEGLILHLDANDVDSYDGDGTEWVDISDHEYSPATDVSEHFNTVLYSPSSSGITAITGVGFQPDLVWTKNRSNTWWHQLVDSVRGGSNTIYSNGTNTQGIPTSHIDSLDSDGFTVDYSENIGNDHVAWCFKAGGVPSGSDKISIDGTSYADESAAGLTAGNVAVTKLSANTKLGFSIATLDNVATHPNKTFSHGLGVPPELVIGKIYDGTTDNWHVMTPLLGANNEMYLNTTDDIQAWSGFNNTAPDFNHINLAWTTDTSYKMIFYSFASKRGVSKVGSYTGDGSTSNKIYIGFEPAFVMVKRTDSTSNWRIYDNKRGTEKELYANTNAVEPSDVSYIDFNRDGFTLTSNGGWINNNGGKFIYLAFAKNTNETSLIPNTDLELHLDAGDDTTVSTSTWSDSTSNNNDVTLSNFSSTLGDFYEKEVGDYIQFDGVNDRGTGSLPVTATGDVTVEAWVRFTDSTSSSIYPYVVHLGRGDTIGNGLSMARFANTGSDAYKFYTHLGSSYELSSKVLEEDRWYHLCVTWVGTTLKQYVDGELVGNHTLTFNKNLFNAFTLGAYRPGNAVYAHFLKGGLGQVRVYQSGLTQDQIRQNFNFTKNDYPNGFNGALTNMSSSDWNSDGYFTFSANDDRIQPSFQPTVTSAFTMSVWVKRESGNSGYKTVIDYTQDAMVNSVFPGIGISHSGTGDYQMALNGGTSVTIGAPTSNFDHLVFVYNGGTSCKTYINGVGTSRTLSAAIQQPNSSTNFVVGNSYVSSWSASRMSVSDVKFYSRELTDAEVTAEYTLGYNGIE